MCVCEWNSCSYFVVSRNGPSSLNSNNTCICTDGACVHFVRVRITFVLVPHSRYLRTVHSTLLFKFGRPYSQLTIHAQRFHNDQIAPTSNSTSSLSLFLSPSFRFCFVFLVFFSVAQIHTKRSGNAEKGLSTFLHTLAHLQTRTDTTNPTHTNHPQIKMCMLCVQLLCTG